MSSDDVSEAQAAGTTLVSDAPVRWERACLVTDLFPERGAAALFGDVQVALFRLPEDPVHGVQVYAVQNLDPFSGAHVMSRGIVGTRAGEPTVAAPVYKQVFSLISGQCLVAADKTPKEGLSPHLATYPVEVRDGVIHVGLP